MTEQAKADQELLQRLIDSEIDEEQRGKFEDMQVKSQRYGGELTRAQREWATSVALRAGVDMGSANLVSSGQVKPKPEERASLQQFLGTLTKSLVPPHRRPKP